jgi:hypothetical protein
VWGKAKQSKAMTFGGRAGAQGESQRANKSRVLGLPVAVADDDNNNMQHVTTYQAVFL